MRILWVKAGKLLPVDTGGKIRSYNLLRQLDARHELVLLSYYGDTRDAAYESAIREHFPRAETIFTGVPSASALHYATHVASAAPYAVTKFASAPVYDAVSTWLNDGRFDVAVCDFLSASLNFPARSVTPSVLFQHNVESVLWRRQAAREPNRIKRIAFALEAWKMARYERATVARFPHVIAVSDRDRDEMASMTDPDRLSVVPTGVDVARYRTVADEHPDRPNVMFLGSMDWEANVDAVEHFCRAIWPAVRRAIPAARFRIVGRDPHPRVRKLASDSVEVTGTVPSVIDYLKDAAVVVVPLRVGGGTRLKIFEAMAAGRAVVSTAIGAEGLDVTSGRDLILADEDAPFADAVVGLLRDGDRRRLLGVNAAASAARYDWPAIALSFEQILRKAATDPRPVAQPARAVESPDMRILVLDGNENQAVAAVRALAGAGHVVNVGSDTSWSKAGWSRSCAGTFTYPPPDDDAASFVESVASRAAESPGTLVLPMTEQTTLPLSAARAIVAGVDGRLVLPDHDTVLRAFDKEATTQLAASLGVDVPRTLTMTSDADVRVCREELRFPVVLKPRSSQEMIGGAMRTTGGPVYARTAADLERAWRDLSRRCEAALAQEFVEGAGTGYFALMRHGALRAEFAHRRIRDVRPTGSGSSLRVSIAPPPRVREAALAILESLGWHGVAMVEFRVRPDGTPTFLEVNGRFWNSLALPIHAGLNFPALVAQLAEQGDVPLTTSYREGVRCRWLLGDARHLAEVLRGAPPSFPGAFPGRLSTLRAVLMPSAGMHHDNFSWRDPLPGLGDWLHFLFRKLPRRSGPARAARVWHAAGRPSHP